MRVVLGESLGVPGESLGVLGESLGVLGSPDVLDVLGVPLASLGVR